jgi:anti-anti-sigma regulatory factor
MIEATNTGGTVTITVTGKFNFACYQDFHRVIGVPTPSAFVIDLRKTTYVDSAALGMMLLLRERVGDDAKRVTIQVGAGQPREVLTLANFSTLFTLA